MKSKFLSHSTIFAIATAATIGLSYAQTVEINPAGGIPAAFTLAPSGTWNWDADGNMEGWTANPGLTLDPGTPIGGVVTGTAASGDPNLASSNAPLVAIPTPYRTIVEFSLQKEASDPSAVQVFWADNSTAAFSAGKSVTISGATFAADGNFKTVRLTFPPGVLNTNLSRLRIDPINDNANIGKVMSLDYVRVYTATLSPLEWDTDTVSAGAQGGTGTWDLANTFWWNGAANTTWPNTLSNIATFGGTAGTVTVAAGGVSTSSADFQVDGYTITGDPITLLSDSAYFKTSASVNARIDSALVGSAPLSLATGASGGFALGGDNSSLTGGVTVVNNSIGLITDTALGTGTATFGVSGGTTFVSALGGPRTISNNVVFSGARTVIMSYNGIGLPFPGDVGTGITTIGNLTINGNLALNCTGVADIFLSSGLTVNGVVSGSNSGKGLVFDGSSGTMTLTNSNTFTGGIRWENNSVLLVNSDAALGDPANNLTFASGGSGLLKTSASITSARQILISGANTNARIDTNGSDSTWSGAITNAGASTNAKFRKLGAGRLTLSTATSTLGAAGIVVQGGTLEVASGTITSGSSTTNGVEAGAELRMTGGSLSSGNFVVGVGAGTGTFNLNSGTYTNGAEFIVGWSGDGVVNLNGGSADLNQFSMTNGSGNTSTMNLNGGSVTLNFFNDRGGVANDGTAIINFNGANVIAKSNRDTGKGFIETDTADLTVNVQAGGAIIDSAGFDLLINPPLVHDAALGATLDGGLTKNGLGTLLLAGASTYTGDTDVNEGCLSLDNISAIPDVAKVNVADGAAFGGIVGASNLLDADIQNIVDNTNWAVSGASIVIDTNGADVTVAANITGDIGLIKKGDGELTLTGANTYTGPTVIEGGTIAGGGGIADVTIAKTGATEVTLTFTASGLVDVYRSSDLQTWGAAYATDVTSPYVDAAATDPKAFYVLVPAGQPYPPILIAN